VVGANDRLLRPLRRPLAQLFLRLLQAAPIERNRCAIATPIVSRLLEGRLASREPSHAGKRLVHHLEDRAGEV